MKINDNIFELISEMEYIISNNTLSKNTFINAGLSVDDYGYRYPVRISLDGDKEESKTQIREKVHTYEQVTKVWDDKAQEYKVIKRVKPTPDMLDTMYYAFGSLKLYIGDALVEVLKFLENRYNIDFNELEEKMHNVQE